MTHVLSPSSPRDAVQWISCCCALVHVIYIVIKCENRRIFDYLININFKIIGANSYSPFVYTCRILALTMPEDKKKDKHEYEEEEIYDEELSRLESDFGFLPYIKEAEKLGWLLNMQPVRSGLYILLFTDNIPT